MKFYTEVDGEMVETDIEIAPEQLWSDYQDSALACLKDNDVIAIRCLKAGVPYPSEWLDYDNKLRVIMHADSGDPTQPLPTRPANHPAGT